MATTTSKNNIHKFASTSSCMNNYKSFEHHPNAAMSVESLFSDSTSEEGNEDAKNKWADEDEDENEDNEEYLDLLWMFSDLMSFEHIHYNNIIIDREVQSERDTWMDWSLEELQMANEVDSTFLSSSPEDACQRSNDDSPLSLSDSSFYTISSSQDSEGSGELESMDESGKTSDSS